MTMIECYECGKKISSVAEACPNCGAPSGKVLPEKPKVGFLKKLFILFFWGFIIISAIGVITDIGNKSPLGASSYQQAGYKESAATYEELNTEVGCDSKYSDDKKRDIFKARYYNNWMEWSGRIAQLEADLVSLNLDGFGLQDLIVTFEEKGAGYSLKKDDYVTVRFLMRREGGCFLPFSGERASIK